MADGIPLGPYVLQRKLARGGMAEIFLARKEGPEGFARELVVKRMLPHLTADPEVSALFRAEARIVARMNHPNVVHVYDFGEEGGTGYLVMELVRGVDLRALTERAIVVAKRSGRRGAVPARHAAKMLSFVCEGLAHAHALKDDKGKGLGVVHRDITPSNVLVSFDGAVKVADFGVANIATRRRDTAVRGKYAYLSPEQARGEKLDARSDLYNVGILLYETITGEALFPHDDPQAAKALAAGGKIPRLERLRDLGSGLERVARKALDERPEGRYRDALELRADLEKYLRNVARPSDTVELGRYVRALFPDVLAADRRAPRAAGTVPLTAALGADALEAVERGVDGSEQTGASTAHTPPAGLSDAAGTMEGEATTPELNPPSRISPPPSVTPNTASDRISTPPARNFEEKTPLMSAPAFIDPLAPPAAPAGTMGRLWARIRSGAETLHQRLGKVGFRLAIVVVLLAMALGVWAAWSEPERGQLSVEGGPAGAMVYVDGVAVGALPLQTSVAPGQHQVALRDGARVLAESATVVRGGQVASVQLQGEAQARLRIESDPEGAAVWVGGERVGVTPLALTLTEPTNVEVRADGFAVWQRDFPAEVDSAWWVTLRAPERLRPRRGALRISAAGNYEVWIDGEHRGQTPLYAQLRAGRHRVELRLDGAVRRSRSVMVRTGRERHIDLSASAAPAEELTTLPSPE